MPRSTYAILGLAALLAVSSIALLRDGSPSPQGATNEVNTTERAAEVDTHRGWASSRPYTDVNEPVDVHALARSLVEQGRAALADGDLKQGFELYRRAVEYDPTAETHGLVGDLYLRMAVRSEAAFHLSRAAELDPENPDRWIALANAYYLTTDPIAAAKALDRAKRLEPTMVIERDRNNFVVRGRTGTSAHDS